VAQELIKRFEGLGVEALYVSNDIDGTDPAFASSTGTPEPGGLTPDEVDLITRRLGERFPLIGADLVEVAPPLSRAEGEPSVTLETSSRYLKTLAELALRHTP
jgi:agmatinase